MRLFLTFITLVFISACASTIQLSPFPSQATENPENGKSRIYIIRSDTINFAVPVYIFEDEKLVGELYSGGFLSWDAVPGSKTIKAIIGKNRSALVTQLEIKQDQTYYLIVGSKYGILSGLDRFEIITKEEALARLERTKPPLNVKPQSYWFSYNQIEIWYYQLSIGFYGKTMFTGKLKRTAELLEAETGKSQESGQIEAIGLYYPLINNKTMVGFQFIGGGWDYYGDEWFYRDRNSVSAIHYLGERIGKGLFLRGDLGISIIELVPEKTDLRLSSEVGLSMLLGLGYAIPVTKGARIIIAVNNETAFYPAGRASTSYFSIGGLW